MTFLLKLVEKRRYLDDLMRGSLYMNPLAFFWKPSDDGHGKFVNSDRYDIFEGTLVSLDKIKLPFEPEFLNVIGPNPVIRLSAYQYVNLFSTSRGYYDVAKTELVIPNVYASAEFGRFVVVITDEAEFRRRVLREAQKQGIDCVFGDVNYHPANDRGDAVAGNMLHLMIQDEFDLKEPLKEGNVVNHYDCFDKWDRYAYQKEWRICVNRGKKEISPYRLEIGPMFDIAFGVHVNMLYPTLIKSLANIKTRNVLAYLPRYGGTVSREEFKTNIHGLRPNRGYLIATVM